MLASSLTDRWRRLSLALAAACLLGVALPAASTPSEPGGFLEFGPTTFVDDEGRTLEVALRVQEFNGDAGRGAVVLILNTLAGRRISLCSTHGPIAQLDFATEVGNFPLQGIQCGRAGGQIVAVDECLARAEAHGFAHVDAPEAPILGTVSLEIRFATDGDLAGGDLEIRVHSERGMLIVRGRIDAPIMMSTCD